MIKIVLLNGASPMQINRSGAALYLKIISQHIFNSQQVSVLMGEIKPYAMMEN